MLNELDEELDREAVDGFLTDLTELTRKYGVYIEGCGCCGSPWLSKVSAVRGNVAGYETSKGNTSKYEKLELVFAAK